MNKAKLESLAQERGFEDVAEMLNECRLHSIVPAICMNEECDADYDYEPDQDKGWCDECCTKSVQSCLIISGLI